MHGVVHLRRQDQAGQPRVRGHREAGLPLVASQSPVLSRCRDPITTYSSTLGVLNTNRSNAFPAGGQEQITTFGEWRFSAVRASSSRTSAGKSTLPLQL